MQTPKPIRAGDIIDVSAGPSGDSRRGVVVAICADQEPPVYEVEWADGTMTRLYASDRLVTLVDRSASSSNGTDAVGTD